MEPFILVNIDSSGAQLLWQGLREQPHGIIADRQAAEEALLQPHHGAAAFTGAASIRAMASRSVNRAARAEETPSSQRWFLRGMQPGLCPSICERRGRRRLAHCSQVRLPLRR